VLGAARIGWQRTNEGRGDVRSLFEAEIDSLEQATDALAKRPDVRTFAAARDAYKRLEGVVEFYAPALATALNSRRQEVDDDDAPLPATLAAAGFPAIEAALFSTTNPTDTDAVRRAATDLRHAEGRLHSLVSALRVTDAQLFEIGREELARLATLGIAGFDAPVTGRALVESAAALDGLRILYPRAGKERWGRATLTTQRATLDHSLAAAADYLRANPDFDRFNRLAYIVGYDRPAAQALDALRRASGAPAILMRRPWRLVAPSVYDSGAFDSRAYAPDATPRPTPELLALGARLFRDSRLSGPGTRSCASCHQPAHAFTDGLSRPTAIPGAGRSGVALRHTPSLLNAGLQPAQFSDERSVTLEEQVGEVLRSRSEMGSSLALAVQRLRADASVRAAFTDAFGGGPDSAVTERRLRQALASYVRSLQRLDSRFDRAVRGDTAAITPQERRGFDLVMGKARCGTCHFAPLFGGTAPPLFTGSDVEVVGTPARADTPTRVDADSGRARIDHWPIHLRAFKVPTLRNAALSAPYMHNGVFRTLDEVLRFYDVGGGAGAGARLPNQTLLADSLHLSAEERAAIVAFIGALTDTGRVAPTAMRPR
jgi:cytochrome c peroxidase